MKRIWDVIMGIFMIIVSFICQAIVIFIVVNFLCAAIASHFDWREGPWIWITDVVVFLALNALTFYEFRRLKVPHRMLGRGGGFFLLPRGIYRIIYGRETYFVPKPPAGNFQPDTATSEQQAS